MAIKSAYELAMERLAKDSPSGARALTGEQKERMAELDRVYTAKIAEQELALKPQIGEARAKGDPEATAKIEEQLRRVVKKLRQELEQKKEAVRQQKPAS